MAAFVPQSRQNLVRSRRAPFCIGPDDLRSEQSIEQKVAGTVIAWIMAAWPTIFKDQHGTQAATRCGGSRLARVVRLGSSNGNQRVVVRLQMFSKKEFKLSNLVSTSSQLGKIVALDEEVGQAQAFTSTHKAVQRCPDAA